MQTDIVSVAFGFTNQQPSLAAVATDTNTSSPAPPPPPPYTLHGVHAAAAGMHISDSTPFLALKHALHEQHPQGSVSFGRQWSMQVEGEGATTLQTSFRRFDFFVTAWTATLGGFLDTRGRGEGFAQDEQQRVGRATVDTNVTKKDLPCWEVLRGELPRDVSSLRIWATSLPDVLRNSRIQASSASTVKSPGKAVSNPNASFGSVSSAQGIVATSPRGSLLKFTQATLSIPIREIVSSPSSKSAAGDASVSRGDGSDFAVSRALRVDVLRSALNEVVLLMLGGGAAPTENAACEPSVTSTPSYQNSIGVVGVQICWVPSSASSTPPLSGKKEAGVISSSASSGSTGTNGASDEETNGSSGGTVLAKDVVLEFQFLTQSSTNAGKKAIESAIREFLPGIFFDAPSSFSIGIANQHDGSVQNITLRSPSLSASAPPPTTGTPTTQGTHQSWSAAVTASVAPRSGSSANLKRDADSCLDAMSKTLPTTASEKSKASKYSAKDKPALPLTPKTPHATKTVTGAPPSAQALSSAAAQTLPATSSDQAKGTPRAAAKVPKEPSDGLSPILPPSVANARVSGKQGNALPTSSAASLPSSKPEDTSKHVGGGASTKGAQLSVSPSSSNQTSPQKKKTVPTDNPLTPLSLPSVSWQDDLVRQSELLLMHAQDLSILRTQYEELISGSEDARQANKSSSKSSSLSSSNVSACTTVQALLSSAPLVNESVLGCSRDAVKCALMRLRECIVGSSDTAALRAVDFDTSIGPHSKMLTATIESNNVDRANQYRVFQRQQKVQLLEAISAYSTLFSLADDVVLLFQQELRILNMEQSDWNTLSEDESTQRKRVESMINKRAAKHLSRRSGGANKAPLSSSSGGGDNGNMSSNAASVTLSNSTGSNASCDDGASPAGEERMRGDAAKEVDDEGTNDVSSSVTAEALIPKTSPSLRAQSSTVTTSKVNKKSSPQTTPKESAAVSPTSSGNNTNGQVGQRSLRTYMLFLCVGFVVALIAALFL